MTKREDAFKEWMDTEHPFHSIHEHLNRAAYERWLDELKTAFEAGWSARKKASYQGQQIALGRAYRKGLTR